MSDGVGTITNEQAGMFAAQANAAAARGDLELRDSILSELSRQAVAAGPLGGPPKPEALRARATRWWAARTTPEKAGVVAGTLALGYVIGRLVFGGRRA